MSKEEKKEAPKEPEPTPEPDPVPVEAYMIWNANSPPFGVAADEDDGVATLQRHYDHAGDDADLRLVKVSEVLDGPGLAEMSAKEAKKDNKRAEYATK